jgi:hypothetical protein
MRQKKAQGTVSRALALSLQGRSHHCMTLWGGQYSGRLPVKCVRGVWSTWRGVSWTLLFSGAQFDLFALHREPPVHIPWCRSTPTLSAGQVGLWHRRRTTSRYQVYGANSEDVSLLVGLQSLCAQPGMCIRSRYPVLETTGISTGAGTRSFVVPVPNT